MNYNAKQLIFIDKSAKNEKYLLNHMVILLLIPELKKVLFLLEKSVILFYSHCL